MSSPTIDSKVTNKLVLAYFCGRRKMTQCHKKETQITQNIKKHTCAW